MGRTETGVYIHIPFCARKCRYCDFLSLGLGDGQGPAKAAGDFFRAYGPALVREIQTRPELQGPIVIDTVYLGGGTPTVLPASLLAQILEALRAYPWASDAEVTVEANPKGLGLEKAKALRQGGANRLSLGLQAWDDGLLALLGRSHTRADFLRAYEVADQAGFKNLNLDLMFALPGQTLEGWLGALARAVALRPAHISAYALCLEPGTPLWAADRKGLLPRVTEEGDRAMYHAAVGVLTGAGYQHYELSNFARPGFASRHNLHCWRRKNYVGLGLGAHSFFCGLRYRNTEDLAVYVSADGPPTAQEVRVLSPKGAMAEHLFLGLRLTEGVCATSFRREFGLGLEEVYGPVVGRLQQQGLLAWRGNFLRLTPRGMDLANRVMGAFLLEEG
jgi:oxygen-independent coproporphyrinogen-3 oxidase